MNTEGERLLKKALRVLIESREGCYFLGLFFERSGVEAASIDVNNPNVMYANEGRRALGLWMKEVVASGYGLCAFNKCLDTYARICALDRRMAEKKKSEEEDKELDQDE